MADAGASGTQQPPSSPKFFCHKCVDEIATVRDDFTCPRCGGGFIEEVTETPGNVSGQSASNASFDGSGGVMELGGLDFIQQLLRGLSEPGGGAGGGGGGVASVRFQTGPNTGNTPGGQPNYRRTRSEGASGGSPAPNSHQFSFVINAGPRNSAASGGGGGSASGGGGGILHSNNPDNPMENMLFTFLNDLVTGLGGGPGPGVPILSNFGDYVWGRDGLDAIVTQLMNQMEGTGPPPLATHQIETLPSVRVTPEQVERKLQCSVCWDDFSLNEEVKQLECDHLYHTDCIIPWLKLHGTCPICRKDLTGQIPELAPSPSPRFESENPVDSTESSSTPSSRNSSTNASSDSSSRNRQGGQQQHSTTNNPSIPMNPGAALFNQFIDPFIMGLAVNGQLLNSDGTISSSYAPPSPQENSGHPPNPRDGNPPRGGGNGGSGNDGRGGLDNMDLDFD